MDETNSALRNPLLEKFSFKAANTNDLVGALHAVFREQRQATVKAISVRRNRVLADLKPELLRSNFDQICCTWRVTWYSAQGAREAAVDCGGPLNDMLTTAWQECRQNGWVSGQFGVYCASRSSHCDIVDGMPRVVSEPKVPAFLARLWLLSVIQQWQGPTLNKVFLIIIVPAAFRC